MTITPEMIEEVAEWVRAFDDHADDAAAETLLKRAYDMKMSYAAEFGPNAALASALRTAYHDDGEVHYAKYSSVPEQWLRMAAAARAHADAESARQAVSVLPRRWAKAADVPDGVRFEEVDGPRGDSWVKAGAQYRYYPSNGGAGGREWKEFSIDAYAPFVEVLP